MDRGALLSIPNALSLSRLGLAAAFVAYRDPAIRLSLIVAASITDFLDGWMARRSHAQTSWGALLDPIADRMFVFCAVCVYLVEGLINTPQYFVIISRDLMTAIGFIVARLVSWLRPIQFRARLAGKVATALQLLTLIAVLIRPAIVNQLIIALGLVSLVAVVDYTLMLWHERARPAA